MTVSELRQELMHWEKMGYGGLPVLLMNLNIQEHEEAEEVNLIASSDREKKALEIR